METNDNDGIDDVSNSQGRPTSSNISASEIDEETAHKLRGDAIGDTMYSEVFVLNTLIQFSDLKWSKEVEDNLCFLWDMTEETDVCRYLFQVSYPSLACSAVVNYNEPRFVEIVVGIFANLLCAKCEKNVKEDEIKIVLNLLSSNDPYILIQVMRFTHAVSFMFEKLSFMNDEHLDRINFILYSSVNKELLVHTFKTISLITDESKLDANILKGELLQSALVAYKVIKEQDVNCDSELELFESSEIHAVIKHLVQFVCNICCYIENFKITRLITELNASIEEFINEMCILLVFFAVERNLLPLNEEIKFYMEALTYICRILAVSYTPDMFVALCQISFILTDKSKSLEIVNELLCYFISVGNVESLRRDLKKLPVPDVKIMLSVLEENACNFEFYYLDNLREIQSCL